MWYWILGISLTAIVCVVVYYVMVLIVVLSIMRDVSKAVDLWVARTRAKMIRLGFAK